MATPYTSTNASRHQRRVVSSEIGRPAWVATDANAASFVAAGVEVMNRASEIGRNWTSIPAASKSLSIARSPAVLASEKSGSLDLDQNQLMAVVRWRTMNK
jgi:hypothetical protein